MALMTLQNIVYAWFKEPIPDGYDIDHIDGDTLNNDLSNLQMLSRKENLAKRKGAKNQWAYIKQEQKACIDL